MQNTDTNTVLAGTEEAQVEGGNLSSPVVGSVNKVNSASKARCRRHPYYLGLRKPQTPCEICEALLAFNRAKGVREKRASRRPTEQ